MNGAQVASLLDVGLETRKAWAEQVRQMADLIEAGEVTEYVIVANNPTQQHFMRIANIIDRWRLLGALEYAKDAVNHTN